MFSLSFPLGPCLLLSAYVFFFSFISQDMPFSILPSDPCSTYSPGFISNHLAPSSTLTPEPSSLITLPLFIPPIVTSSMSICLFQFPGATSCISCQLLFPSVFWLDCNSGASPLNVTWHLTYWLIEQLSDRVTSLVSSVPCESWCYTTSWSALCWGFSCSLSFVAGYANFSDPWHNFAKSTRQQI